jgi:hypothetical protein
MGILIQEEIVAVTEQATMHLLSNSNVYKSRFETDEELLEGCAEMYGACIGNIYRDITKPDGSTVTETIGYIFQRRATEQEIAEWDGTMDDELFQIDTWVTLHTKEPVVKTQFFYRHAKELDDENLRKETLNNE